MIIDITFRTMSCNGVDCDKTVTFKTSEGKEAEEQNPWLKNARIVNVPGKQPILYCSDSCEVSGVTTGQHNPVEQRKVIDISTAGGGRAAIQQAAEAARLAETATKELKAGPTIQQ